MDYNIGAIKVFARQLKNARPIPPSTSITGPAMTLGTLLFQRVWLQVSTIFLSTPFHVTYMIITLDENETSYKFA